MSSTRGLRCWAVMLSPWRCFPHRPEHDFSIWKAPTMQPPAPVHLPWEYRPPSFLSFSQSRSVHTSPTSEPLLLPVLSLSAVILPANASSAMSEEYDSYDSDNDQDIEPAHIIAANTASKSVAALQASAKEDRRASYRFEKSISHVIRQNPNTQAEHDRTWARWKVFYTSTLKQRVSFPQPRFHCHLLTSRQPKDCPSRPTCSQISYHTSFQAQSSKLNRFDICWNPATVCLQPQPGVGPQLPGLEVDRARWGKVKFRAHPDAFSQRDQQCERQLDVGLFFALLSSKDDGRSYVRKGQLFWCPLLDYYNTTNTLCDPTSSH